MKNINLLRSAGVPALILLIPFVASLISSEMNWGLADYIIAFVLMSGSSLIYNLVSKKTDKNIFRSAVVVLLATSFILIWANLAVGLIGSEDHPANQLYFGVIAIGIVGAIISRVKPLGMTRTLYLMAAWQFLVPIIAMNIWKPPIDSGFVKVLIFNFLFVIMWSVSAFLFKRSIELPK